MFSLTGRSLAAHRANESRQKRALQLSRSHRGIDQRRSLCFRWRSRAAAPGDCLISQSPSISRESCGHERRHNERTQLRNIFGSRAGSFNLPTADNSRAKSRWPIFYCAGELRTWAPLCKVRQGFATSRPAKAAV